MDTGNGEGAWGRVGRYCNVNVTERPLPTFNGRVTPEKRPWHTLRAVAALAPTRILVVEDELDIAQLIKHSLERNAQAQVDVVTSGDAALQSVGENLPAESAPGV